jgi:hypothetical protein
MHYTVQQGFLYLQEVIFIKIYNIL